MDVKIGLLVQNRISVQDCLQEHSRKTGVDGTLGRRERGKENKENQGEEGTHRGLKALKKESYDKLLAYQHLFYLLQTDPSPDQGERRGGGEPSSHQTRHLLQPLWPRRPPSQGAVRTAYQTGENMIIWMGDWV